jgi:hypothetical protein
LIALLLAVPACSRVGDVAGEVAVPFEGRENPAARLRVRAIPATAAFERDWAAAQADFQRERAPFRRVVQDAEEGLGRARLAWDRAVATPRARRRDPRGGDQERLLFRGLREAEQRLREARRREAAVMATLDRAGAALLERHAAQEVLTDAAGRYLVVGLPLGTVYVNARLVVRDRTLIWFLPVQVRAGLQQVDLTEENVGGWPYAP